MIGLICAQQVATEQYFVRQLMYQRGRNFMRIGKERFLDEDLGWRAA